jgi:hypothetical protein
MRDVVEVIADGLERGAAVEAIVSFSNDVVALAPGATPVFSETNS